MILDASLLFDGSMSAAGVFTGKDATAWTVSTNVSTNDIDLGGPAIPASASGGGARDIGAGGGIQIPQILCQVTSNLYSTGGGTVNVQVCGAPDDGTGAAGTYVVMAESGVITLSTTNPVQTGIGYAGQDLISISVPNAIINQFTTLYGRPRFLRVRYVVATAVMTAGRVVTGIVLGRDDNLYYNSGFTAAN